MKLLEVKVEKVRENGSIERRSVFFKDRTEARIFVAYANGGSLLRSKVAEALLNLYPENSNLSAWEVGYKVTAL